MLGFRKFIAVISPTKQEYMSWLKENGENGFIYVHISRNTSWQSIMGYCFKDVKKTYNFEQVPVEIIQMCEKRKMKWE